MSKSKSTPNDKAVVPADPAPAPVPAPAPKNPEGQPENETGLVYAAHAPVQSLPVRVKNDAAGKTEGQAESEPATVVKVIDLAPGRPWPLPADHKLTASMQAAGFVVPADKPAEADASAEADAPSEENAR